MMEKDEEGTLEKVKALQREVIEPKVAAHLGRIVKITGDGFLIEFASPVEAVRCAAAIQDALKSGPLQLRIGINLGDILIEPDGDVYGDGVNIAARLEGLADPGGVCISGAMYDQVEGKIDRAFESRGAQQVKNIARPVRVYALAGPNQTGSSNSPEPLPLPDKPSIAVLPLTNMSGDPEQEYFADGITEDIITALSKWRWLFVIARNSTFIYKGRAVDVKQVGRDLGVRYVLEGSVRKAVGRVRITAQLIDAATGGHVWAERYDGDLSDVFALQDEITQRVVIAVDPAIRTSEIRRIAFKPTSNLDAYDLVLRGSAHFFAFTRADLAQARSYFEQATRLDPSFAFAFARLAETHGFEVWMQVATNPVQTAEAGIRAAERAIALDDLEATAHVGLAHNLVSLRRTERAVTAARRAVELNPNLFYSQFALGQALTWGGYPQQAISPLQTALRINPHDPYAWGVYGILAFALFGSENFKEALTTAERAINLRQKYSGAHLVRVASLAKLGLIEQATEAARGLIGTSVPSLARRIPVGREEDLEHLLSGLRVVGFAE
jgi:adenylate cyclase